MSAAPQTKEEYELRYNAAWEVSGYGIESVTNHFPCPFCAAKDWHVVRLIDFGDTTEPIPCEECGRSARFLVARDRGAVHMGLVQTAGADPPSWVPIPREAE